MGPTEKAACFMTILFRFAPFVFGPIQENASARVRSYAVPDARPRQAVLTFSRKGWQLCKKGGRIEVTFEPSARFLRY
jgi:hypothetical protein